MIKLTSGRWFSAGTPASSTTKTGRHDIAEILLKVALSTINQSTLDSPIHRGDRMEPQENKLGFSDRTESHKNKLGWSSLYLLRLMLKIKNVKRTL